jgi:hypothetical protein
MAYHYSVLRFVPDPARGEFINIGAVAGDAGDWEMRVVRDLSRAEAIDHKNALGLAIHFMEDLDDEVVGASGAGEGDSGEVMLERLRLLSREMQNVIQLSVPAPLVAASADEALDLVFEEIVLDTGSIPVIGVQAGAGRRGVGKRGTTKRRSTAKRKAAKRSTTKKRSAAKVRRSTTKKRSAGKRRSTAKKRSTTKHRSAAKKRGTAKRRSTAKRKTAGSKAAGTRKRKTATRKTAGRKAAGTRKRKTATRKTAARKAAGTRKRRTTRRRTR